MLKKKSLLEKNSKLKDEFIAANHLKNELENKLDENMKILRDEINELNIKKKVEKSRMKMEINKLKEKLEVS